MATERMSKKQKTEERRIKHVMKCTLTETQDVLDVLSLPLSGHKQVLQLYHDAL